MTRGDHLFYYRAGSIYSHHGICCGDGSVVHYESSLWMKLAGRRDHETAPRVKRVPLAEFAQGSGVLVRNYDVCDHPDTVIERSLSRIGEIDYSLFQNNCEHFAVWCKTGWPHSTQVDAHRDAQRAVVKNAPIGVTLLRVARRTPVPYRGWAYAAAMAAAGTVYVGTYLARRNQQRNERLS